MRSASSASRTLMIGNTGPKVSSRLTAISGVASARIVGRKKVPGRRSDRRSPPAMTRAPRATASAIWDSVRATCGGKVIAPTSTPSSTGGCFAEPWRSDSTSARQSSVKRSATDSSTSTRSVRTQTCPLCANALQTAARAARFRSASASTINGDFPPSSITAGTSRSPQRAATCRPTLPLPVKKIMSHRSQRACPTSPRPGRT